MAEADKMANAKQVFKDLCTTLDNRKLSYDKREKDLVIIFSMVGEDFPMRFVLMVDAERQLLRVSSRLPVTAPEDKRMEVAIAACAASYGLADGSFDYDINEGTIDFRLTASFRNSKIGEGLFDYLVVCSSITVDKYNDKFFTLCKGMIDIKDFLEFC